MLKAEKNLFKNYDNKLNASEDPFDFLLVQNQIGCLQHIF